MHSPNKRLSLFLVLFVVFLDEMGVGLVYPMFSSMIFIPSFGLVDPQTSNAIKGLLLGVLLAGLPITAFFCGPILGTLSDQKGRKPLYLFSLTLAILGYGISILGVGVRSIYLLILSRLVIGIAAGNAGVVSATIADLSEEGSKAKYFGLFSMAAGVGFAIGPFLGGFFSKINFIIPFVLAGVGTLFNLILIYFFFNETLTIRRKVVIKVTEGISNLKKAFHLQDLKVLFVGLVFFCFGWSFFYEFIPVTWISFYKFDATKVGLFYAFGSGVYALSSGVLIRPFINRFKPHSLIFYSIGIMGILLLTLPFFPAPSLIWVYLALVNFLVALAYPTYSALVSDSVDQSSQGEILGIYQSIQMLAFGISPLFAGSILGSNPQLPMFLGGSSLLITALILGIFLRKKIFRKQKHKSDLS